MAVEVETLLIRLEARVNDFEKQMARAQRQAQVASTGITNTFAAANQRLSRLLVATAGLLSVGAITAFIRKTVELGSSISDLSQRLGITAEDFQRLSFAASQTATDQDAVVASFRGMTQFLTQVSKGGKEQAAILKGLGLTFNDLKRLSPVEVFTLLLDRIGKIQDPLRRASILTQVMSRSAAQLGALSQIGAAGMEDLFTKADETGAVLSNEKVEKLDKFGDKLDELGRKGSVAGAELLEKFLPVLTQIVDGISDPKFQEGLKGFVDQIGDIVRFLQANPELGGILGGAVVGNAVAGPRGAAIGAAIGGALTLRAGPSPFGPAFDEAQRGRSTSNVGTGAPLPQTIEELNRALGRTTQVAPAAAEAVGQVATSSGQAATATRSTATNLQELIDKLPPITDGIEDWTDLTDDQVSAADRVAASLKFEEEQLRRTAREQAAYNAVNAAGVEITSVAGAAIAAQARAYFDLQKSIEKNIATWDEYRAVVTDTLSSIIDGIRAGQTAAEIATKILNDLASKLLDAAIQQFVLALLGAGGTTGGGLFGALFGGARASGGPVQRGRGYVVGEHGREFFIPNVSGTIVPSQGGGGDSRAFIELVLTPEVDARIRRVAGSQSERISLAITRASNAINARQQELKG